MINCYCEECAKYRDERAKYHEFRARHRAQRARDRAFITLLALLAVIAALVVWPRSGDAGEEPVQWTAPQNTNDAETAR